jgi:two-component system cell cycle sensor histidine kinase/response regulator CckA
MDGAPVRTGPSWESAALLLGSYEFDPSAANVLASAPGAPLDPDENLVLFRAIFETSQDAIGVSQAGIHTLVNPSYVRLFGFEREEELVGTPILDLIAPAEHDRIREYVRRRLVGEPVPASYETRGRRRDATEFEMAVHVAGYRLHGAIYTLVILRDVSQQRAAEAALRESQEMYRELFEVNTAVKLLIDPESGAIVHANPAATAFYGWSLDELRAMRITDINQATPGEVHGALARTRAGDARFWRFRHRIASGEVRDVEVYTGTIRVGGRSLLASVIHDVTERRRLEEQLQHAQKLEAVGRLAGGIAHDFNNLLTLMLGYADEIATISPPGTVRDQAEELRAAARRAAEFTKQLLAFSRRQRLQPSVLRLDDVVAALVPVLRRLVGETVQFESDLRAPDGWVLADEGQIAQVLLNLVVNARDAMPRGGRLVISSEEASEGPSGPGDWVTLRVRDTGLGMDEPTRQRVFEPFFTTKELQGGTGLGLSTVYGIAVQSGGHIAVDSAPGQGSTFTLHLPRVVAPEPSQSALPPEIAPPPASGVVLVVEDQDEVREFVSWRLRKAGYNVLEAHDGATALAIDGAWSDGVDLLVTDVVMPGLRGPDLYLRLRQRRPGLRALYISGWTEGLDVGRDEAGSALLPKPFTGGELLAAVRAALS